MLVYYLYISEISDLLIRGRGAPSIQDIARNEANNVLKSLPSGSKIELIEQQNEECFMVVYNHPIFKNGAFLEVEQRQVSWGGKKISDEIKHFGTIPLLTFYKKDGTIMFLN